MLAQITLQRLLQDVVDVVLAQAAEVELVHVVVILDGRRPLTGRLVVRVYARLEELATCRLRVRLL